MVVIAAAEASRIFHGKLVASCQSDSRVAVNTPGYTHVGIALNKIDNSGAREMKSRIAEAIGLETHAVALTWADTAPEAATSFKPGRWGCVVSLFAAAAAKGKVGVFDRQTYGCWGGGVGLGFGHCYENFPGGVECFCRFLAGGNEGSEPGETIGKQMAANGAGRMADDFLKGERYLKTPETTKRF